MLVDNEINDLSSFLNINDKGSDSIVFQLGSHSVKFGLASQLIPFVIPNCIAYKKFTDQCEMDVEQDCNNIDSTEIDKSKYEITDTFLSKLLNIEQETIKKMMKLEQRLKIKRAWTAPKGLTNKSESLESEIQERKNFELTLNSTGSFKKIQAISLDINEDITENNFKWTSIQSDPSYIIGREALSINEQEKYLLRYPIKYGFFNNEYSFQAVLDDLNKIIFFCVNNVLRINRKEISNYNVVLIIPDLLIRSQIKGLVNIFLRDLNFKNIILHTESVMSTFGAAMQSSCVVDIGSSKTSVCCVDEGMIIEDSLIRKNYGGDDITKLLYMMLLRTSGNKNSLPMDYFAINNPYHCRIFEKLKENECEFPSIQNPSSQFTNKSSKIWLHRKSKNTKVFNISLTEHSFIPPLSLFYADIYESFRNVTIPCLDIYNDIYNEIYSDPEDIMGELIKTIVVTENPNPKKEDNITPNINMFSSPVKRREENPDNEDSESVSPSRSDENSSQIYEDKHNLGKKNTYESMFNVISLEDMICQSIMSVPSPDMRKKLANSILLVGGSVKFKGMIDYLEDRLIDKLTILDNQIDRIEIINFPTVDAKTLTWIGGSIIPKLESTKDMWINREKWLVELDKNELSVESKLMKDLISKDVNRDNASNVNDNESRKETETVVGGRGEKFDKEKPKKKEKNFEGGVKLIREKSPFQW